MPNQITATGLQTASQAELIAFYTAAFQTIFGADINLDSDSPDGQIMNDFIQAVLDNEDLITNVNAMFDPDQAIGVILDQRVAINGIQRLAGTFTITNVTLVISQSVNLYGLDQSAQSVYTVADNAGNQWQLESTQLGVTPGTYAFAFQAANTGAVLTVPNTITVPVSIILGVSSINNPTTYTTLGINEETDAALRIRRQQSVSLASQGYLKGLLAALLNINGVTSAFVYENDGDTTDGDGVPGHSIWVIVAGSGTAVNIATAIYNKRNAGCGMFGSQEYNITQVDGSMFPIFWDVVTAQNIFIFFTATSINGTANPQIALILSNLPSDFVPGVFSEVNVNTLATDVQSIDPNTLVTLAGFSTGQSQVFTLSGVAASGAFELTYNGNQSAAINWNDAIGTIQSKVQAVTGLSAALVTGSISSQTLTFNLAAIPSVQGLLYASSNSLATSFPAAITFSYNYNSSVLLSPSSKKDQFAVQGANILILPMILSPQAATVARLNTLQLSGVGGYGTPVYSIQTNNSGGSINSSSGLYTAGSSTGTDVALVTDVLGNTATSTITVV